MCTHAFDTRALWEEINNIPTEPDTKHLTTGYGSLKGDLHKPFQKITRAHIESFNFMIDDALPKGIKFLRPLEMEISPRERLKVQIEHVAIGTPVVHKECATRNIAVYPAECRMRGTTYRSKVMITFKWSINGKVKGVFDETVGEIPVMVKSKCCNLASLTPEKLVQRYEDSEELGGYFIVNGKERVVRFLTAQRRNYPLALSRKSWKDSGQLFTEYGISIRCVRMDQMSSNMIMHYLNNGTVRLRLFYQKQPIFLPLVMVLKALVDVTDQFIFKELLKGKEDDTFFRGCIINMLRIVQQEGLNNHATIKKYIGERFRVKCKLPPWYTDEEITDYLLRECVAIHLITNEDKFNLLVFMTKKLFACVREQCAFENPDSPMFHEIYLSGHIYFSLFLEKLDSFMTSLEFMIDASLEAQEKSGKTRQITEPHLRRCMARKFGEITRPLEHLIATGNLNSKTGLGLMQKVGLSVMAEKINFLRFLSHFRAVHRGAFFAEMKTTACRKLFPEAWGFLCPVHTPDGAPCGLLNHLAEMCEIVNFQPNSATALITLGKLGLEPLNGPNIIDFSKSYPVILDGKVVGHLSDNIVKQVVDRLRICKTKGEGAPVSLEIGFVPKTGKPTQFPALFLFSTPSRMMRPVYNLSTKSIEMIGTFEQVYMDICITKDEAIPETTHQELRETSMLSLLATQIPFPDFNQSPRNMYACQMKKQTMGTASHTLKYRSDIKMYNIITPQTPLVRPTMHDYYHMDDYPYGTNGVIAVISYTGYDMEDALILNKASVERGFKQGYITKTQFINLRKMGDNRGGSEVLYVFGKKGDDLLLDEKLDKDGLPYVGTKVGFEDPICAYIELATGETKVEKYKSTETAYISDVKLLGSDNGKEILQEIAISYTIPRRPIIGDKFANRHGQKGVCSMLWPQENMPFTESGMTPDIIFNPHGYPSRMTIGMMLESMAGKSASAYGKLHDATPFSFSEENPASEYYGKLLESAGFNYYGTEKMYSGVDGRELTADIFIGVIYYIRLRHMVGDKYQVRSTGPIDNLTHQPVKGRKRFGGVRFGEMERDSLLAHGTSFLLHDRLYHQSDESQTYCCVKCGCINSTTCIVDDNQWNIGSRNQIWMCRLCNTSDHVKLVSVPYVLRYLLAEFASVNIKLKFNFE